MHVPRDSRRLGGLSDRGRRDVEVESDRHFYMRRVTAERQAVARAVTQEARERRMELIQMYLEKLQAISA